MFSVLIQLSLKIFWWNCFNKVSGFLHEWWSGHSGDSLTILVTPKNFLYAEFAAATVLVSFCVLLGKISFLQSILMAISEVLITAQWNGATKKSVCFRLFSLLAMSGLEDRFTLRMMLGTQYFSICLRDCLDWQSAKLLPATKTWITSQSRQLNPPTHFPCLALCCSGCSGQALWPVELCRVTIPYSD